MQLYTIQRHANKAGLPINEVIPILDTVIVRPDAVPAPAPVAGN